MMGARPMGMAGAQFGQLGANPAQMQHMLLQQNQMVRPNPALAGAQMGAMGGMGVGVGAPPGSLQNIGGLGALQAQQYLMQQQQQRQDGMG